MDGSAWIGLIGALAGVLATGIIGISTAALTHRWQEGTRRRERADRLCESRALLRREAYIRFLVAADNLGDYLLAQEPVEADLDEPGDVMDRLRSLRLLGDPQFAEYFAARLQVNLVAGEEVNTVFDRFIDWMHTEIGRIISLAAPLQAGVFEELTDRRKELVDAMRAEQDKDLVAEG